MLYSMIDRLHETREIILKLALRTNGTLDCAPRHTIQSIHIQNGSGMRVSVKLLLPRNGGFE
jgi:hypothetical protein